MYMVFIVTKLLFILMGPKLMVVSVFPNLVHHGKLPQHASIFIYELQSVLASLAILLRQPSGSYVILLSN